ncbi:hypothetical protein HDU83_000737 [Entophlyctis luteolus]|nr:hypothetical protein HDU83_000737 [Entophlyctis luteolus]
MGLLALPTELLVAIFLFIPPPAIALCARISRRLRNVLLSPEFAALSLDILETPAVLSRISTTPSATARAWFTSHPVFQAVYADHILVHLDYLIWPYKDLRGHLPLALQSLTSLATLDLSYNQLSGPIPPDMSALIALEKLNLRSNHLTGNIPSSIGKLANLKFLVLGSNRICGTIPKELRYLRSLIGLNLSFNELTGEVPPELGELSNLEDLNLSANSLSGTIPQELAALSKLRCLSFFRNQLKGTVPIVLSRLPELYVVCMTANEDLDSGRIWEYAPTRLLAKVWLDAFGSSGLLFE